MEHELEPGVAQSLFHRRFCLAGALLDSAYQFVFLAFRIGKVVVAQLGEFLFQLPLDDVPVTFQFEFIHRSDSVMWLTVFNFADYW